MFIEVEDIFFTVIYTMIWTILSLMMSFRFVDILGDEPSVEKLTRHFLLWPVEGLVILTLCLKYYIAERKENVKK